MKMELGLNFFFWKLFLFENHTKNAIEKVIKFWGLLICNTIIPCILNSKFTIEDLNINEDNLWYEKIKEMKH